ncbi:glycosyltransferase [Streptomyces sp. NPDC087294]|uniref:glycosyltransferase n=1 Tax=Streptomyces sp. NPDC087294 TaxID=3365777 RepID=UPI0037F8C579
MRKPGTAVPSRGDLLPRPAPLTARPTAVVLDVVVPVFNEQAGLEAGVRRLHAHLRETFPYPFRITVADNASTDGTPEIAARLAAELPEARWLRLAEKGRGRALHTAWSRSQAPVLAYVDVDLSTDLAALLPLVAPLISGHSDLAIGTRLAPGSRVVRGPKREAISRCYNVLLRSTLAVGFSDAQCGFKAIRRDAARQLLPSVRDSGWFFDTELLVLAERAGLRIHEVPVDWIDDPDSSVDLVATALADLRGIARVGRALGRGEVTPSTPQQDVGERPLQTSSPQPPPLAEESTPAVPGTLSRLLRFAAIGAVSTVAHLFLFGLLRPLAGAQVANAVALLICAVANTAVNRRLTFGVRGRHGMVRHQSRGLAVFAVGLALTSGALAGLHAVSPGTGHRTELAVLVGANLVATLLRFLLLQAWVFRAHRSGGTPR